MGTRLAAAVLYAILQGAVDGLPTGPVDHAGGEATKADPSATSSNLNGLVGFWSFDEGQGGTAANVMGLNGDLFVNGKIGGAVMEGATWSGGESGKAACCQPGGPGFAVGYMEALDCDTAVSVAAWIRLDGAHDEGRIWN